MVNVIKFKLYIFCYILIGLSVSNAQNSLRISGTATDGLTGLPVEAATVFVTAKKDSALLNYTLTDVNGNFELELKKTNRPVVFRISDELFGEYEKEFETLDRDISLGTVSLSQKIDLEGVVINAAPPIRVKSDTLEFDAASFKVRPDANVESLLRQLPGVDIDENGKITVNGKEVNQVLVNGKPFFDKDGKIALENLPAEIINKVQVTDTRTKKEELSGESSGSNNATINLTIDKDKNKGIMLKAMAGYGTDERYESSLLFNYFNGNSRLSILGSANNINSVGFSMNEIFDNMGSMRNRSVYTDDNGSFGINGIRFGSGSGITESQLGGFSYSDTFAKGLDFNSNFFYTRADSRNRNFGRQQELLPDRIYTTTSHSDSRNLSTGNNFSSSIEFKIDSTSTIWFEPKYSSNQINSSEIFDRLTVNENGDKLNSSSGETTEDRLSQSFSNRVDYYKSFKNNSGLSIGLSNENSRMHSESYIISNTFFYRSDQPDNIRNQLSLQNEKKDYFDAEIELTVPLADSVKLGIGARYGNDRRHRTDSTFDYDQENGGYTAANTLLTTDISSEFSSLSPFLSVLIRKKKFNFRLSGGIRIMAQDNTGYYTSDEYRLKLDRTVPSLNLYGNYRFGQNSSVYFNYQLEESFATAEQLLPIENLSDPLNTVTGNPDLKTSKSHSLYMGFNNFNFQSKTGFYFNLGGRYEERGIANYRITDEDFRSVSGWVNINGNYLIWAGINLSKSFKSGKSKFRTSIGFSTGYNFRQGFTDGVKYDAATASIRPRLNFNWELGEVLTVNPSYSLSFQTTDFKNYRIKKSDNISHVFKLATTSYRPRNLVFGNDFSYTYNSNVSDGFKKDFFLWNTSLGYNFWKDQLTFKVKVYDVLGQNSGVSRTVSPTLISDLQNDVLSRYVMFSLSYKLDKFGGKKKKGGGLIIMD